ncbi:MAG: FkbM family methyltransferase [Gemmatimonas sp.]
MVPPIGFRDDVIHIVYEADAACAEAMAQQAPPGVHVVPFCLGGEDGAATLHVTANPFFSSLLEPDPAFGMVTCEVSLSGALDGVPVQGARYDARYAEEMTVVNRVPVAVHALDGLIAKRVLPVAAGPDFLSLDTQGTEHDILRGAERAITDSVVAIATEIEFRPMYRGQALFSAILDFTREHGFDFVGFTHLDAVAPARLPVGARARDEVAFGDALFFRRLESLPADESTAHLMATKLAFVAACFGYIGTAVAALDRVAHATPTSELRAALAQRPYVRFLDALYRTCSGPQLHDDRAALVAEIDSFSRRSWPARLAAFCKPADHTADLAPLLRAHGFAEAADLVRRRRRAAAPYLAGSVRHIELSRHLRPLALGLYRLPAVRSTYRFLRDLLAR